MCKVIFYSFRTNKSLKEFQENKIPVFVFGSLKKDFEKFSKILEKDKPEVVLGFAAVKSKSRSESVTVNRFGRDRKINRDGQDYYNLESLTDGQFESAKVPTTSFCNWTIYKTKEFIKNKSLNTRVSFIHFNPKDTLELLDLCKNLS